MSPHMLSYEEEHNNSVNLILSIRIETLSVASFSFFPHKMKLIISPHIVNSERNLNNSVNLISSLCIKIPLSTMLQIDTICCSAGSYYRIMLSRSIAWSFCGDDNDLEDGKASKDRDNPSHFPKLPKIQKQALLSGLAYCIASCSMILVNKFVLSAYGFNAPIFLMLYQNIVSVAIVSTLSLSGAIPTEQLTWNLIKVWLPVNIIFVGMLITSMFSLKYINVAMLTILKNVANVITASGETYFFKKQHGTQVWIALILMIISAVVGGITDLSFHAVGYTWQIINCFLTASYSLTLRHVMDSAKQATKSGNLNELSMVLLNNVLSLPLGIILLLGFNEVAYLLETPLLKMPNFWVVITASGVLGLAISFTSMWFLHQTSATTYSLVGSLNKIPLSVAGIALFNVRTSMENSLSILFGLLAGVFFARAKLRNNSPS